MNNETKIANGVAYHLDWDMEGHIVIEQPKTVALYHKLKYDDQPPAGDYFWAFSREQFDRAIKDKHLEGKRLCRVGSLFGTHEAIEALETYYAGVRMRIKAECDPQEVYFYECNNHEYMYNWDGDEEAIKLILNYWGEDVARGIKRVKSNYTIDEIIKRENE